MDSKGNYIGSPKCLCKLGRQSSKPISPTQKEEYFG